MLDAHDLVHRRIHDQHRTSKRGDGLLDVGSLYRFQEGAADEEGPASDLHRGLALARYRVKVARPENAQDMLKVGRRTDRHHRGDIRQRGSGYDRSRSTQAVPDKEGGWHTGGRHGLRGCPQIVDVRSEAYRFFRGTRDPCAGEVEPQDADTGPRERACDVHGGAAVLPASETMGENRPAARSAFWRLQVPG